MELRQLEYFLAVAESGAFSRAAMLLSVGQPILSRQIKALEQDLGAQLYHRTGRGIVLTEAGRVFEQHARSVVDRTKIAREEMRDLSASPTGSVLIGMPPSVGVVLTVPIVQRFREQFPKVSLTVMEGFSGDLLEWLTTGRIDMAVLYNAPRIKALSTDPLLTDELFLLGPSRDPAGAGPGPVPASRLNEIPLILSTRPHGLRLLVDEFLAAAGVTPRVPLEINAVPSTLRLVEFGVGYTILSPSCAHDLIAAGRIRSWPLVEPKMTRSLVLAVSTRRTIAKAGRALMRIVRAEVDSLVRKGRWGAVSAKAP